LLLKDITIINSKVFEEVLQKERNGYF